METRFEGGPASARPSPVAPTVLEVGWDNGVVTCPVEDGSGPSETYVRKRFHAEAVEAVRALLRVMERPEEGAEDNAAALARCKAERVLFHDEAFVRGAARSGMPVNWQCG